MKTGRKARGLFSIMVIGLFITLYFSPMVQALGFNASDLSLNYLVVTSNPDVVKPGNSVIVTVSGKLSANSSASDVFHIQLSVDTIGGPAKTIAQGDLILPAGGTSGNYTTSVAIPLDTINGTYLYMNMNDGFKSYSKISLSLIQNPSYFELEAQVQTLQSQSSDLQSANNTATILMYAAIFVAAIFIVTTTYILAITFKIKKGKKEETSPLQS